MTSLNEKIEQLLTPVLNDLGLQLVRVLISGGTRKSLQIMIERSDWQPLMIADCTRASREISVQLDIADPIEAAYQLEVSSPGLDRPLIKFSDYERFVGQRVKIQTHIPIADRRQFVGVLVKAENLICTVQLDASNNVDEPLIAIDYEAIAQARLEPSINFKEIIKNKAR